MIGSKNANVFVKSHSITERRSEKTKATPFKHIKESTVPSVCDLLEKG